MNVTGKIKHIYDTVTYESGFSKREFVVTTNEQYPQDLKMEFVKDKCTLLDNYSEGDDVTVDINLRGNEYNGRYYVNLSAWRIDKTESVNDVTANAARAEVKGSDEGDLPF